MFIGSNGIEEVEEDDFWRIMKVYIDFKYNLISEWCDHIYNSYKLNDRQEWFGWIDLHVSLLDENIL